MKQIHRSLIILVCVAVLLALAGCNAAPAATTSSTAPQTTFPVMTAQERYAQALSMLERASSMQVSFQQSLQTQVGNEHFSTDCEGMYSAADIGTDAFIAKVVQKAAFGEYQTEITEIYHNGKIYTTVYGYDFSSDMTAEEFTARHIPGALLDASLYGNITAVEEAPAGDATGPENAAAWTLTFAEPSGPEAWLPEAAQLTDAQGFATLDREGRLLQVRYSAEYSIGGASFSVEVSHAIETTSQFALSAPANPEQYTPITSIDGPVLMEQTYGYLLESDHVTATQLKSTLCQAAGTLFNQQTTVDTYSNGDDLMVQIEQSFYQTDHEGNTLEEGMTEIFRDGVYTAAVDGGEPEKDTSVTAEAMQVYYRGMLLENLLDLSYVDDVECIDLGSTYLLELQCADELGESFCKDINYTLFEDETYLSKLASAYKTTKMDAYLAVDKYTGLPTALGMHYEGIHTIEGYDYIMSVQLDQSFDLASLSAYESITEKSSPDTEPENKATPLFYHVTGGNGQEMWLLGTIHVGDDRTGYLPQEIYDAFAAADALAVEFDTEAFDELLEEDEELQSEVSNAYYYSDGSNAESHITDKVLYELAVQLMKASGNHTFNTPYLKISMWANAIDNFYLRQGYTLASDKGVDTRLLKLAKAQGKTVLDIESGEFQAKMLTGWTDPLQEELLLESAAADMLEYCSEVEVLYEQWCRGDEAELIEALTDDTSEMTDEERKLYKEYNKIMMTDRNAAMLKAAKGYLESDEVIFYAVGLAHVLAEDGLLNTLREAGYTVELVNFY